MKLIMENWRKWLGLEKDPPADGLSPVPEKVYSVHKGGVDPELEKEGWTWDPDMGEYTLHNPPREKPAIEIDHPEGLPDELSRSLLNLDGQHFTKSDRDLHIPSLEGLSARIEIKEKELTELEAAETISASNAENIRSKIEDFKQRVAHSDTLDINLLHMGRELDNIEDTINKAKEGEE